MRQQSKKVTIPSFAYLFVVVQGFQEFPFFFDIFEEKIRTLYFLNQCGY
jgi:hypothetical protein